MSNLENKLKKIVNTFNNIDRNLAYEDIKKLSTKYHKNINVLKVLMQIAQKMGDIDMTINSLKKILLIEKNNIEYLSKIYKLFLTKSLLDEALTNINLILKIDKDHYEAIRDKAYIYFLKNIFDKAKKYIDNISKLKENDFFGYNIKGLIYLKNNNLHEAKNYFEKSIKINDKYVDSYNNLGVCLLELEKLNEAYTVFKNAREIEPDNPKTLINLGNVLSLQDNILEAIKIYNKALAIDPNNQEILSNIAICYCRENKEKEATIYYDKAIKINPLDYKLKYAYCTLQLKLNNFSKSWGLFDSRLLIEKNRVKLKNLEFVKNNLFENLKINPKNKLLILREQGIGEEILFSSVYQNIINNFKKVKIEADKRLLSIFSRSFGNDIFVEDGYYSKDSKISKFDNVIYAGSMVQFYRKRKNDFNNTNYLLAREDIVDKYKEKLTNYKDRLKVGISWKSIINIYGSLKSLSIKDFEPLFTTDRLIINLQYGSIENDKKYLSSQKKFLKIFNDLDLFNDIESCMGLLKNLDLFITVSNSTAHFAGALGIPTILICPKKSSTYFYWNTSSGSSIWYKNIKVLGIENSISETIGQINKIVEKHNEFKFSN
ncbi:tetratricopeptide repeat protein [bacterium]|nr:tetratricopeptide repeat protein [bacterium]